MVIRYGLQKRDSTKKHQNNRKIKDVCIQLFTIQIIELVN